jgi:crotonobetainyl-CoA:carnitine CoA-transferase CaiB-like acyl-CoA transferase
MQSTAQSSAHPEFAHPESAHPAPALPLAGIRVVDLTSAVVGPYATQVLADYGAEVIKVEERSGDVIRWISGRSRTPGMSGKFMHMNRNKRSVSLDLKTAGGREAMHRLVASADVFLHNMRTPAIARLGLTYGDLVKLQPRLIYAGVVGFGSQGRYSDKPAYDSILQGGTALASLFAVHGGAPRYVPYVVIDRTAALMVVHAVMAALFARERDGGSREIEVPMFESYAGLLLSEHLYGSTFDPPISPPGDARLLDANAAPIKTADGYICVTTNTDAQVAKLFDAFGRPELKDDARFNTSVARIDHIAEFFALRAAEMAKQTTAWWIDALARHDVPAMQAHTLASLLEDPHLKDVALLEASDHPTQGRIWNINVPTRMTGFEPSVRRPAPHIGEHTAEVLGELGYDTDAVAQLYAQGVAYTSMPAATTADRNPGDTR